WAMPAAEAGTSASRGVPASPNPMPAAPPAHVAPAAADRGVGEPVHRVSVLAAAASSPAASVRLAAATAERAREASPDPPPAAAASPPDVPPAGVAPAAAER